MFPWSSGGAGDLRTADHVNSSREQTRRHNVSPTRSRGQRNVVTGEAEMDYGDPYMPGGNIHMSGMNYGQERDPRYATTHGQNYSLHGGQLQQHDQMFRGAQASKQMVYEVYGNCITMLEELESRELKQQKQKPLQRSGFFLPDQKKHEDKAVKRKLETQLLLFQSQLSSCDRSIKTNVTEELKKATLNWNAARADRKVPTGHTDTYVGQLFEILDKGNTEHPQEFYQPPHIGERDMHNAMQAYMKGNHKRNQLDKDFRDHPDKKAAAPKLRSGGGIDTGAERLAEHRPDLASSVSPYQRQSLR